MVLTASITKFLEYSTHRYWTLPRQHDLRFSYHLIKIHRTDIPWSSFIIPAFMFMLHKFYMTKQISSLKSKFLDFFSPHLGPDFVIILHVLQILARWVAGINFIVRITSLFELILGLISNLLVIRRDDRHQSMLTVRQIVINTNR